MEFFDIKNRISTTEGESRAEIDGASGDIAYTCRDIFSPADRNLTLRGNVLAGADAGSSGTRGGGKEGGRDASRRGRERKREPRGGALTHFSAASGLPSQTS